MIVGNLCEGRLFGELIRSNSQYDLVDNRELDNLVISKTVMKPDQATNGHKHDGIDEVYFFTEGIGAIEIDSKTKIVYEGDICSIKGGQFHKVYSSSKGLTFFSVFQKYDRA